MLVIKMLSLLCLILLGLSFAVLNSGSVHLNYYFGELDLPFALVTIVILCTGALLGLLSAGFRILRLKRENSKLQRELKLMSREKSESEAIPLDRQ